jgi:hypothetical protein
VGVVVVRGVAEVHVGAIAEDLRVADVLTVSEIGDDQPGAFSRFGLGGASVAAPTDEEVSIAAASARWTSFFMMVVLQRWSAAGMRPEIALSTVLDGEVGNGPRPDG